MRRGRHTMDVTLPRPDARDPPPRLAPHENPTPAEMARIARRLLREAARHDPVLAAKMRARGLSLR